MPQLKAVLFDLDDTLIDWSGFSGDYFSLELPHFEKLRDSLTQQGAFLPDVDTMLTSFRELALADWERGRETMVAPHILTILTHMLKAFGVPEHMLSPYDIMMSYEWDKVPGTTVFPEVPGVLDALRGAGVELGIVTNAFQPMAMRDNEMEEHRLLHYFPTCRFAAADVGNLKPHPAIFEAALECISCSPDQAVFVGDSLTADIVGAQRVGMKAVWRDVGHGHGSGLMTREIVKPDATIHDLTQLFPLLDRWYPGWR